MTELPLCSVDKRGAGPFPTAVWKLAHDVMKDPHLAACTEEYTPATPEELKWDADDDRALRLASRGLEVDMDAVRVVYARMVSVNMNATDGSTGFYRSGGFLNHSCRPNALCTYSGKRLDLVALKDIEAGSEITINYVGITVLDIDSSGEQNPAMFPLDVYRSIIERQFGFACKCAAHPYAS